MLTLLVHLPAIALADELRVTGNLVALGDCEIRLERPVFQFMSSSNGQHALAAL